MTKTWDDIMATPMKDIERMANGRFVMTTDTTVQGRTCIKCGRGGVRRREQGGGVLYESCELCGAVYFTDYRYGPGKIMLVIKNAAVYSQSGAEAFRIDPRSVQHVWEGEGRYHVGDMLTPQDVDWLWRAFTLRNPIRTTIEHLGKRFIPVGKTGWKWINEDDGYPVDDEGDWLALAVAVHDRRSLYGCVRKWAATLTPQDLQDFKSQQIVAVAMNGFNDWEHGQQHSTLANELMSLASTQRGWSPRQAYEQKMSMGRDKRFVLPVEPQIVHPWQTRGWDEGRKDRHYKRVLKK